MWVDTSSLVLNISSVVFLFFLAIIMAYKVGKDSGFKSGFKEASGCKSAAEMKFLAILEEKLKTEGKSDKKIPEPPGSS